MPLHDNLTIVGPGRTGVCIARAAIGAGYTVTMVSRTPVKHQELTKTLPDAKVTCDIEEAVSHAKLLLLAVSDCAIEPLCKRLARNGVFQARTVVAHLSGALTSTILDSAKLLSGCHVASAHPLQTFAIANPVYENPAHDPLKGIHWYLEGDNEAIEPISILVKSVNGKTHIISSEQKSMYHAACVFGSNYLTAVIDIACGLMQQTTHDRATTLAALAPLIRSSLDNTLNLGAEHALTGPVSRGDTNTLREHLSALKNSPAHVRASYKALGLHTVDLARRKGSITSDQASELMEVLRDGT